MKRKAGKGSDEMLNADFLEECLSGRTFLSLLPENLVNSWKKQCIASQLRSFKTNAFGSSTGW